MVVARAREPPQLRPRRGVAALEIPDRVGAGQRASLLDLLPGCPPQRLDGRHRDDAFEQEIAVLEIELLLLPAQDVRLVSEHLLGGHGTSSSVSRGSNWHIY